MQPYPSVPFWIVFLCAVITAAVVPRLHAAPVDKPAEREIIIVHPSDKPQSAWDEMVAHKAEYLRLKEKFEPTRRISRIDLDACENAGMLPPGLRPPQAILDMRGCP